MAGQIEGNPCFFDPVSVGERWFSVEEPFRFFLCLKSDNFRHSDDLSDVGEIRVLIGMITGLVPLGSKGFIENFLSTFTPWISRFIVWRGEGEKY
jgi:hypothetical protein